MRSLIPFNHDWLYMPARAAAETSDDAFTPVTLPHANVILPANGFDDAEYQFVSAYRKRFTLPEPLAGRRLFIDFEGAMIAATVSINGHTFAEHKGGFTPFSFDLTPYVREDGENLLEVELDSTERTDIPPFGHTVDYMTFGGIYREVALRMVDPVFIDDVFVFCEQPLAGSPDVTVDVRVRNLSDAARTVDLYADVELEPLRVLDATAQVTVAAGEVSTTRLTIRGGQFTRWTLDNPALYTCFVALSDSGEDRDAIDQTEIRFGVREARFRDDGFYLNGEPLKLLGLNRHQIYPFIGAAAPARLQRKDADIIKFELGCNIVRTSHYPQSRHFLDRCDEIGLLVFEEIPGWQHIGDEAWKTLALRDVRAMIERDRNRPAIIIWGVRINESWDDHDLYTQTNALARLLDPTRPTGGVRFFMGSEFLEDVYTLNDFSKGVLEPEHTPHLITEFNGHMFPTKTYDIDVRRVEHALRHAYIQSQAHTTGGVSGAIGWCAFDYNTHREFGAGDRVCYHGVMDMYRLPKYAARFYESQIDPAVRVVLKAATNWQLGDYSEGIIEPIHVFSNCDEIEVFVGDVSHGRFKPAVNQYPNLKHPPFIVRELGLSLAQPYADLRVVGYLDGRPAAEHRIDWDGQPAALTLTADDAEIDADGIDMTRIAVQVTDRYGNPLPYIVRVVTFEILEGDAVLIGDNPFALVGGQGAVYLKAGTRPGPVTLRARMPRLPEVEVTVTLV